MKRDGSISTLSLLHLVFDMGVIQCVHTVLQFALFIKLIIVVLS